MKYFQYVWDDFSDYYWALTTFILPALILLFITSMLTHGLLSLEHSYALYMQSPIFAWMALGIIEIFVSAISDYS